MTQEQLKAMDTVKVMIEEFETFKGLGITSDDIINLIKVISKETTEYKLGDTFTPRTPHPTNPITLPTTEKYPQISFSTWSSNKLDNAQTAK